MEAVEIRCNHCFKHLDIEEEMRFCPFCGGQLDQNFIAEILKMGKDRNTLANRYNYGIMFILVLAALIFAYLFVYPSSQNISRHTSAIYVYTYIATVVLIVLALAVIEGIHIGKRFPKLNP